VRGLLKFDDGSGNALYAGGYFTTAGGIATKGVGKWNGSTWSALGSGVAGIVQALAAFDDGGGPALYVGGLFNTAGGVTAMDIAHWNGLSWSALGSGLNSNVFALTVFDDGGGPALYAGGFFTSAGGVFASHIAKWNGSGWSALASGTDDSVVSALTVFDDGGGPALYAGGDFTSAGGVSASGIAKWNGSGWSALGAGVNGSVYALLVFNDGGGQALYVGGDFSTAGGVSANSIAKWNGSSWIALGSGMPGVSTVYSLTVFDDGSGPALYAGGNFSTAGGLPANFIAIWNGSNWSALGSGVNGNVDALAVFDDGSGPALIAGGEFPSSPAGASYLARWGNPAGCGTPGSSICEPGASGVIGCPCANSPASTGLGCNNSANTGGAELTATGIARITYDTVEFTTNGEKPTATSIVLQGNSVSSTGVVFGQGVRCVTGALKRLYVKTASAGSITAPQGADLHVHARSAALGDSIAPGTHRYYGVYYRDPNVLGGCPAASTFNITQQLDVPWAP
jgi:hypothetical protein